MYISPTKIAIKNPTTFILSTDDGIRNDIEIRSKFYVSYTEVPLHTMSIYPMHIR